MFTALTYLLTGVATALLSVSADVFEKYGYKESGKLMRAWLLTNQRIMNISHIETKGDLIVKPKMPRYYPENNKGE